MTVALCLPPLLSLLLGWTAPRLSRSLPPATAVRLLASAMLVAALATGFVLAAAGALVLAQMPLVAALGHWSARVVGAGLPVPVAVGFLAAVTVGGLLLAALRRAALGGRDLLVAAAACRRLGPSVAGLVVVEDDIPDAYALPGFGGRIVVSTAMLQALPADERRVLLAHEAAHLRHRHHLWVQGAELAAAADPLLRRRAGGRSRSAAAPGGPRRADGGRAVGRRGRRPEVGDRALAARALARAGLARAAAAGSGPGRTGVRRAALPGADGAVVDRARALLAGPPRRARGLAGAVAAGMLAGLVAVLVTGADTEARFEAAESAYPLSAAAAPAEQIGR